MTRPASDNPSRHGPKNFILLLLLIALVLAVYWRAVTFDFLRWDDNVNLTQNPLCNPPTLSNIAFYWRHQYAGMYIPVTYSLWTIVALAAWVPSSAGQAHLNPYIFHALNIAVHILSAIVVWLLLNRIIRRRSAAWFGAAFFALHPTCVEAVAWVTGFRDVLSGFLGFACLYAYTFAPLRHDDISRQLRSEADSNQRLHGRYWYVLASVLFLLAVLSKPAAVALIPMAAVIDWLWRRRSLLRTSIYLLPWLIIAAAIILVTRSAQQPPASVTSIPARFRPLIAGDALWFYLTKVSVPINLCVHYGRTPRFVLATGLAWKTTGAIVAVAIAIYLLGRKWKWAWLASLLFLAGLIPVLGFVPFYFQSFSTTADRYMYFALLGPATAVAALLSRYWNRGTQLVAIVVLMILGVLSYRQVLTWRTTDTVFMHALAVNPRSNLALVKLSKQKLDAGNPKAAEQLARRAISAAPDDSRAWINLGAALEQLHQPGQARACYLHVIKTDRTRDAAGAYSNLAAMNADAGNLQKAIDLYRQALALDPQLPQAVEGLRRAQAQRMHPAKASTRSSLAPAH